MKSKAQRKRDNVYNALVRKAAAPDLTEMREKARKMLGWPELEDGDAADFVAVSPRTWRKWEDGEKPIPDTAVKLFWYVVGMHVLDQAELSGPQSFDKLVPPDAPLMKGVFDYLDDLWIANDPEVRREALKKKLEEA